MKHRDRACVRGPSRRPFNVDDVAPPWVVWDHPRRFDQWLSRFKDRHLKDGRLNPEIKKIMQALKNTSMGVLAIGLVTAFVMTVSCDGDGIGDVAGDVCGPCGSIASGQLSISGNTQLDGFFTAVANLQGASATIRAGFEADVLALADVYGIAEAEVDAAFVAQITAAIRADFEANVDGGIRLRYQPPRCSANVSVAVEAQASCEASAECDVQVDPGMVAVECMGECSGSCEGECSGGGITCTPPMGSAGCDVGCEGSCELSAAASCEGTCHGSCDGACSASSDDGARCDGRCEGMCEGTCELDAMASCSGTCHGTCHASVTPPECMSEPIRCEAQCMGMCSGGCAGEFEPPSASANCEASAECNAQASAQAEASLECTPPSLDFGFEFAAGLDASAEAAFLAKLDLLKVRLAAILQGSARVTALVDGEVDGEVVFNPSPVAELTTSIGGLVSTALNGDIQIATGRIPCVVGAFQEAGQVMTSVAGELSATAAAQADFVALVGELGG